MSSARVIASPAMDYETWKQAQYYDATSYGDAGFFQKSFNDIQKEFQGGKYSYKNYKDYLAQIEGASAQAAQIKDEREYAEKQTQSARAWEEYMSSTAYQRAYDDLKKTGLNPRLLLSNAGASSTPAVSYAADAGSSSRSVSSSSSESKSETNSFSKSAVLVALIAAAAKLIKYL